MNTNNYSSNRSRREFLKVLGSCGLGFALSNNINCRKAKVPSKISFYGTGTLNIEKWEAANAPLETKIIFEDNNNDPGPVITNMITGNAADDYNIGGLQGGAESELAEAKTIIPWDLSKISNWQFVWDWARTIPYARVNGKQFGLPIVINADSIIYLEEFTGIVDTYAVIFDKKYKGKTSMEDAWINSAIFAAIYLKESGEVGDISDPGNLDENELGVVMEFLIKKKRDGQFLTFWNGWEHGLELIKSKEVWAMTGWEPIVYAAQKAGIKAKYAVPKEGYEGWSNDLILHRSSLEPNLFELAHKFANWELSGYYACKLAEMRGYVVPCDTTLEFAKNNPELFKYKEQKEIVDHVKWKFQQMKGNVYWQNVRPRLYKQYETWWSRLRNA